MYYSNGNYEAFARPKKPAGVDKKNAYILLVVGLLDWQLLFSSFGTHKCQARISTF